MKKVNVAVIGVGNMGQHHARVYSELPDVNLVGVCDVDEKKAQKTAQKYKCSFNTDYNKFLRQEKIDAVSVVVPTFLHCQVAREVLNMGIHVLLEKPIATNIPDAQKIIKTAQNKRKILMIGHIERFNPAVLQLKRLIGEKILGRIISINIKRVGGMPTFVQSDNVILDLAIHDIDIANFLLGEVPLAVYGIKSINLSQDQEDSAVFLLRYRETPVCVEVNWVTPVKIRALDITGSKAFARLDYIKQTLIVYENDKANKFSDKYGNFKEFVSFSSSNKTIIKVRKEEPLKRELTSFIHCVLYNKKPEVTGKDAYKALAIALEI